MVKKGADCLLEGNNANGSDLFDELVKFDWDSKGLMYGQVRNKHARYHLSWGDDPQEPNYEEGKCRIVAWKDSPLLNETRNKLSKYFSEGKELSVEGNYYYDVNKCGIGFHGDS